METFKITLDISPMPFKRVVHYKNHVYNPTDYQKYKTEIAQAAFAALGMHGMFLDEIAVEITFYRELPKRAISRNWGDLDNLVKGVLDALTNVVFMDDSQVVELHAYKRYGTPRIEVAIADASIPF